MTPERSDWNPNSRLVAASQPDCMERLSCLLDGELSGPQCEALLRQLRDDDEARRRWALLSCAGDALRSAEVGAWHAPGFAARVSAALEAEPTVLSPTALPRRSAARRWLLPGAGAAVAAAVLIAVGLPQRQNTAPESIVRSAPAAAPVVASAPRPIQIDRSPELERYLAAHRELAESTVMPRATPYLRTSGAPQESR